MPDVKSTPPPPPTPKAPPKPRVGGIVIFKSLDGRRKVNDEAEYPAIITKVTPQGLALTLFPPHRSPCPGGTLVPYIGDIDLEANPPECWVWPKRG